jgi:thiol-disulfide isomerase/thioredoxin
LVGSVLLFVPTASIALERGVAAPEFTLPLLSPALESPDSFRSLLQLSDYRGKVIYLDFWDSSCSPCRRSLPLLSQLRDQYSRSDVEFVAINLDTDPNAALRFLAAHPVSYPVVSDPSTRSAIDYGVASLPTAFFISREGVVRGTHRGFQANDINKIKTILTEMIGVDRG